MKQNDTKTFMKLISIIRTGFLQKNVINLIILGWTYYALKIQKNSINNYFYDYPKLQKNTIKKNGKIIIN